MLSKESARRFQKRTYRFCSPGEIDDNVGKLCYRYCYRKLLRRKCKLIVEDITTPEGYAKFLSAGFVVMVEERIR